MALTPQQEKTKLDTASHVAQGLEDQVASSLKENYAFFGLKFPALADASMLTNADFHEMAKDAIDKQAITFKTRDGQNKTLSLDVISAKLMEDPIGKQFITEGGATKLSQHIFTREQISVIANEAGEGAAANVGGWKGTTLANATKGALNYVWTLGASNATLAPAADSVKSEVTNRLKALAGTRPDIKLIIGDGSIDNDGVNKIASNMYDAVLNPKPEGVQAPDALDSVQVKSVNDAMRATIRSKIYDQVYSETETAINKRVDDGFDKALNGGGFIGFILQIANFFGAAKWLAGLLGSPIPDETEIQSVSSHVAASVSDTLTDKNFKYKGKSVSQMNPDELSEAVSAQVQNNLQQNQANAPSFKPENLTEIASLAGKGVKDNFDNIPKLPDAAQTVANGIDVNNPGVTGGHDTNHNNIQVPPGGNQGVQLTQR